MYQNINVPSYKMDLTKIRNLREYKNFFSYWHSHKEILNFTIKIKKVN